MRSRKKGKAGHISSFLWTVVDALNAIHPLWWSVNIELMPRYVIHSKHEQRVRPPIIIVSGYYIPTLEFPIPLSLFDSISQLCSMIIFGWVSTIQDIPTNSPPAPETICKRVMQSMLVVEHFRYDTIYHRNIKYSTNKEGILPAARPNACVCISQYPLWYGWIV